MTCRLLYLVGQLGPGGLEHQLCYLLQVMDRERYQPAVVVWNFCEADIYVPRLRKLGVTLYALPSRSPAIAKLQALRSLVDQLRPEVVHSYSFYTNFAAAYATWGRRMAAVGSVRSDLGWAKKQSGICLGKLSARWPRNQIYNSFSAARLAKASRSLFTPRELSVVRNGLDLQQFRERPFPSATEGYLVAIGSLLPVKRWDRLLKAIWVLKGKKLDCKVRLVGSGPLGQSLQHQAQALGVRDCVEFLGHVDDTPSLLAGALFLVHTSDSEGCPNVVMEAMACGRGVVATDVGDVPLLVEDGQTGFVVPRQDESALAARLATLLTDYNLCRRMGQAGHTKAVDEFGLDRLLAETLAAYRAAGWQ